MSDINFTTRREFLNSGLGLVGIGATALPNYLINSAMAGPKAEQDQRILVILQLDGGNDIMSTLVPHGHKEYYDYRKEATRIDEKDVIKINDELGWHPNLGGWKKMMDEGLLGAVHGIGYPNPNFSHFESTNIWMMGERGGRNPYGWVGRACDTGYPDNLDQKLAVAVGPNNGAALALRGKQHGGIIIDDPRSFGYGGAENEQQTELYRKLNKKGEEIMGGKKMPGGELDWITRTAVTANEASQEMGKMGAAYKPKVEYPDTGYGRNLRAIAGLITGGLSTRIYWTARSGRLEFDTHSNQKPQHDKLMKELNDAVPTFFEDLKQQGQADRVLMCSISEFGRTAKENGNKGTDHAAASAQFLFGPGVKPGIHGKHPSLKADDLLPTGPSLKYDTDFRSMYATVMEKWMNIPSEPVLGEQWPLIDCLA
jgi:uncharacterized protein (DUF1501 family)